MDLSYGLLLSFCSFLVLFLGIGAAASKFSQDSEDDYLLGGKSFGEWMIAFSAGATGCTSFILIAAVGLGYTHGFAAFLFFGAFGLGDLLFWTFCAEKISSLTATTKAQTVGELVTCFKSKLALKVRSFRTILGNSQNSQCLFRHWHPCRCYHWPRCDISVLHNWGITRLYLDRLCAGDNHDWHDPRGGYLCSVRSRGF